MKRPARTRLLQALLWLTPSRSHAVVTGQPDEEGNSVEIARAASRRLRVYWLTNDDPAEVSWLIDDAPGPYPVTCLHKGTPRAFAAYITARYVFFTHGLFGSPAPPPHKTFINLWHGDGPKRRMGLVDIRSSYIVAGTEFWGRRRPRIFDVDPGRVLVTGNPRIDQLRRPATDDALHRLGLDPTRPLMLWLPTYRKTRPGGRRLGDVGTWRDADELSADSDIRGTMKQVAEIAERRGVTVAVKPHVLDADGYRDAGLPVLTTEELRMARTTLYQLLAVSRGLITDYSSVWTDYLVLDRPIGFFCPDLAEYEAARGFNVTDYLSLIPGPRLVSVADFERFIDECMEESDQSRIHRTEVARTLGAQPTGAAERLLDALGVGAAGRGRRRRLLPIRRPGSTRPTDQTG